MLNFENRSFMKSPNNSSIRWHEQDNRGSTPPIFALHVTVATRCFRLLLQWISPINITIESWRAKKIRFMTAQTFAINHHMGVHAAYGRLGPCQGSRLQSIFTETTIPIGHHSKEIELWKAVSDPSLEMPGEYRSVLSWDHEMVDAWSPLAATCTRTWNLLRIGSSCEEIDQQTDGEYGPNYFVYEKSSIER